MSGREARIAENESRFRALNEGIEHARAQLPDSAAAYVCECGRAECEEPIALTREQYEHVRSNARWFAIKPGHEIDEVETVVERGDGFLLIEKNPGEASELVERHDPRS